MKKLAIMIWAACLLSLFSASGWAETMKTRIGELQFTSGYPTEKTVQTLYDELDFLTRDGLLIFACMARRKPISIKPGFRVMLKW